jgi:hypothetical protein
MTKQTASQRFTALLKSLGGEMNWDTRVTLDGQKVTIECWIVPPADKSRRFVDNSTVVMLQRWRDGTCTVFRQASLESRIEHGLDELKAWLTGEPVVANAEIATDAERYGE